jgi:WD40 repeat protein
MAGLLVAVTAGSVVSWQINKRTRALRLADEARRTGRVELAMQAVRESRMAQAVEALYQTARQEVPALSSDSPVNDVAFNAGRVYVATAHTDGVRLWKSPGAAPMLWNAFNQEAKLPHPGEVLSLTFHPREDLLATATAAGDARVRIWKLGSPQPFWESPSQGADDLNAVDFNRTGSLVAAAARSGKLIVWNAEANTSRSISPPHQATTLAFSPLDDRLAAGFTDGTTIWWNVGADAYQNVPGEDQRGKVHNVAFSPDGKSLVMASANGVWVWETGSGDAPRQVPRAEPRVIQAVAWSPQGDLIAAADANRNVSVLDAASLRQQFSFAVPQLDTLTSLAFQPDPQGAGSRKLAVAGFGGSVRIYELNVDLLLKSLEGK